MGLFNEHSSTQTDAASSSAQGPPGPQGVGYKVDAQGNYDIQNKKLTNVKNGDMDHDVMVKSQIEGYVSNKTQYLDDKVNLKADTSDLDDYFKLDGTKAMTGNINMNNNRIVRLPDPQLADEPVTRKFLAHTNTLFYNIFLDLDGNAQMRGNIKMNNNRITGLTNPPNADDEATNKKYTDDTISKANIKPSHTLQNAFKYLMDDVNEWSSEYNIKVGSFIDLDESPHSWDKRVLNITPIKNDDNNYRFRLGIQLYPIITNQDYSLIVEVFNRDYRTWYRQETYVNGTNIWLKSYNTTKFQYHYDNNKDLYYTKTLIKFKKTSGSAPIFVYFTVHFDDRGGDMNSYPKDYKNQVYILAYGITGDVDHVDSDVYDSHKAFEIEKTKMKMLVPLDMGDNPRTNIGPLNMNNKAITNIGALDMNNKAITNIGPLNMNNKAITNIGNLSLEGINFFHGRADSNKVFIIDNFPLQLNKIKISQIMLYNSKKTINKQDVLQILDSNLNATRYQFTFPKYDYLSVFINIERYFNYISAFKLTHTNNVSFFMTYKLFY